MNGHQTRAAADPPDDPSEYVLRLYVIGATPRSTRAVVNARRFCEEHLKGRYRLEIVDIADNIAMATRDQIVAAPTLLRLAPLPLRRFIGDMSDVGHLRASLGLGAGYA
jgi:circadian clock protein KaiB